MKKLFTLAILLLSAVVSFAGNVSEQQALLKAQAFLQANNRSITVKATAVHKMPRKGQAATSACYYVFNADNGQGFVIVSGSDRTEDILGYADDGSFDKNNIPEGLQYMLDGYAEEIEWMEANGYTPAPYKVSATVVEPLLSCKWNQSAPYNNLCPTSNGSTCVTGCVATAMAQIMYYHKWPQSATGSISGYTGRSGVVVSTLSSTTFSWSSMLDTYNSSSSAASQRAVATLMLYCGASVQMSYSPSGSGAYSTDVPSALINKFGYASSAKFIGRGGYSIETWDALITNELVNNRPVYYSGSTSSGEGHAFVCDGRRADGLFHINWGWGGSMNGYYRLSLLDPSSQGIGGSSTGSKYSMRQGAVIGISSSSVSTPGVSNPIATGAISVKNTREYTRSNTSSSFTGITMAVPFYYTQGTVISSQRVGLALYKDGTYQSILTNKTPYYLYNPGAHNPDPEEFTFSFGSGLANGTYQIVPVYQSSSTWVKATLADNNYIEATISGTKLNLDIRPGGNFEVTSVSTKSNNLIIDFINHGEEYNGPLYLYGEDGTEFCKETVAVPANTTDRINFYVGDTSFSMGEQFYISTDYYKREWFYANFNTDNTSVSKEIDLTNANEDKTAVYSKTVRYNVSLTNAGSEKYRHKLKTELIEKGGTTAVATNQQTVEVPVGETVTLEQTFTIEDGQMNKDYYIKSTHYYGEREISTNSNNFFVGYGATIWNADGSMTSTPAGSSFTVPENAAAVDLRSVGTTDITPNSNPNTIYLLESVPTSLKGKNVVNSLGRTGSLTLYDGYPYYIPQLIQTKKIYYKRTFTADEAGSWSTLALPFAPNVVKNETDNKSLTWHTSESDSGKDIWVQELSGVSGNDLTFTNIAAFTEYRPYIISVPATLAGKTLSFQKELSNIYVDIEPTAIEQSVDYVTLRGTCGNTDAGGKYVFAADKFVKAEGSAVARPMMEASIDVIVPPFRVYAEVAGSPYSGLTINSSHTTGINTILTGGNVQGEDNGTWYTIDGIQLNSQPTAKGIYIKNGKKVVIR